MLGDKGGNTSICTFNYSDAGNLRPNFENPAMGNTWMNKNLQDQKWRIIYVGLMLNNRGFWNLQIMWSWKFNCLGSQLSHIKFGYATKWGLRIFWILGSPKHWLSPVIRKYNCMEEMLSLLQIKVSWFLPALLLANSRCLRHIKYTE